MRGLTRSRGWRGGLDPLAGRRPGRLGEDRGAVAVMVAILLAGGVLLGFLALVIDVGQLYLERQQLQSGADSAALAVANACAKGAPECASEDAILALAGSLANSNSADGISKVAEVCGNVPGGLLPACSAPAGNLTDCLTPAPTDGSPFVEVRISTETLDHRFVLPPIFAQTMSGNAGYTGASVGACARAAWESSVDVLLMTISRCEFDADTNNNNFPPGQQEITAHNEHVIRYWEGSFNDSQCDVDPPPDYGSIPGLGGIPRPIPGQGQAGFLDGSSCSGVMPADGNVTGYYLKPKVLALLPQSCEDVLRSAITAGRTLYLPVYDTNNVTATTYDANNQAAADFHIGWLAPFRATGFEFAAPAAVNPPTASHDLPSFLTGPVCNDLLERCLAGVFTGELIPLTNVIPSNNTIVKLVG